MLNTLRKIVQEVNSAKDLKAALGIIVLRVKEAMGSQVCSVYLLDPETNRFVLMATEGLNKRSIGKVSMAPNEGLVGLVGTREEPLNLENAADHPRYRYFAETGEDRLNPGTLLEVLGTRRGDGLLDGDEQVGLGIQRAAPVIVDVVSQIGLQGEDELVLGITGGEGVDFTGAHLGDR